MNRNAGLKRRAKRLWPFKKMDGRRLLWLAVYIVLISGLVPIGIFPVNAAAGPSGHGGGPPPMVGVAEVVTQDVNPPLEYVGHVEAIQAVDLRARVEGFLEKVNFREGSDVQAGDLLYVIEPALYRANVLAAKASVSQAGAAVTSAKQRLDRLRSVRSGGIPATDMDNAISDDLQAKARLEGAQANLQIAEINLGYTEIKAPISGRIGRTAYTMGNLVNPGSGSLARIVQLDPIRVVYSISENDFASIKTSFKDSEKGNKTPASRPRLKLADGELFDGSGRVDFVDNTVDSGTGTIAVRALFTNHDEKLLPGQYVTVLVSRNRPQIMPVVPQAAVLEDTKGRYVLIVDGKSLAQVRRVKAGPLVGTNQAMISGVEPGEKVIVDGVQKVRPGQAVKIANENNQNKG